MRGLLAGSRFCLVNNLSAARSTYILPSLFCEVNNPAPLESTLMKNGGRGVQLLLTRFPMTEICPEEHRNEGSLFNDRKHFYPERPSGVKSVTSFQGTIGTTNAEGCALS